MRVVIAEDQLLLREAIVALLRDNDIDVVAQVEDGEAFLRAIDDTGPELAIVDVRLPPTFTDEGVRAAIDARRRHPSLAVLILSQYVEPVYGSELVATGDAGVGYLLKERVADVRAFMDAVRRVAAGDTAFDREVVAELVRAHAGEPTELADLSERELEVLALMAEGRSNVAIADAIDATPSGVEKHVSSIFAKLRLPAGPADHRRVLAVRRFLDAR